MSKKIIGYTVLTNNHYDLDESLKSLGPEVEGYIEEGWHVYGKPLEIESALCQVMVRYDEDNLRIL